MKAVSQFRGIHPKEETERIQHLFYMQAKGEISIAEDIPFVTKDGTIRCFDVNSTHVEFGGVRRVVGMLRDITDRKRAEEALQESEQKYRSLFDTAGDAIFLVDTSNDRIIEANPACTKMLGYSHDELTSMRAFDLHPEDEMAQAEAAKSQLLAERGLQGREHLRYCRKDGKLVNIRVTVSVVDLQDARVAIVYATDITERKRAEEELRTLSSRHEAILASVPDIIMEVDENKVYTWANRAGLEFFGDDAIGREAAHYFEGHQDTYDTVSPLFQGQTDVIYLESWQRRKDGERRMLAWWCRVLKGADGKVLGALSTARDITEHKQAEELREQLARTLEQKNKELESIVYVASHDLRGPLVNIEGFSRELVRACQTVRTAFDQEATLESLRGRLASVLEEDVPQALDFIQIGAT